MTQLRRGAIGSTLVVILLHLAVVSSGYACTLPMQAPNDAGVMAGMPMDADAAMLASPSVPAPEKTPCQFPWAPDGCQSMAPCAPAAIQSAAIGYAVPVSRAAAAPINTVATPESLTRAPEPPPPRA